jgi:hypothetical protein
MRDDPLYKSLDAAFFLGIKPGTLSKWRTLGGNGLPFVRISSRAVRYRESDLRTFLQRRSFSGGETTSPPVDGRDLAITGAHLSGIEVVAGLR